LRLGAADRGDRALAALDAQCRLVQVADRRFTADRAVHGACWCNTKPFAELPRRIGVAPAHEVDEVDGVDCADQPGAGVAFSAL